MKTIYNYNKTKLAVKKKKIIETLLYYSFYIGVALLHMNNTRAEKTRFSQINGATILEFTSFLVVLTFKSKMFEFHDSLFMSV